MEQQKRIYKETSHYQEPQNIKKRALDSARGEIISRSTGTVDFLQKKWENELLKDTNDISRFRKLDANIDVIYNIKEILGILSQASKIGNKKDIEKYENELQQLTERSDSAALRFLWQQYQEKLSSDSHPEISPSLQGKETKIIETAIYNAEFLKGKWERELQLSEAPDRQNKLDKKVSAIKQVCTILGNLTHSYKSNDRSKIIEYSEEFKQFIATAPSKALRFLGNEIGSTLKPFDNITNPDNIQEHPHEKNKSPERNNLFDKVLLFDSTILKDAIKTASKEKSDKSGIDALKNKYKEWEKIDTILKDFRDMKKDRYNGDNDNESIIQKLKSINESIRNSGTKSQKMRNIQGEMKKYIPNELWTSIGIKEQSNLLKKILLFDSSVLRDAISQTEAAKSSTLGIDILENEYKEWEKIDTILKDFRDMKKNGYNGNNDDESIIQKLKSINESIRNSGTKSKRIRNFQEEMKKYIPNEFWTSIGIKENRSIKGWNSIEQSSLFDKILLFDDKVLKDAIEISTNEKSDKEGIDMLKNEYKEWEKIDTILKDFRDMKKDGYNGDNDNESIIQKLKSINESIRNLGTKSKRIRNFQEEMKKYIPNEFWTSVER